MKDRDPRAQVALGHGGGGAYDVDQGRSDAAEDAQGEEIGQQREGEREAQAPGPGRDEAS